MNILLVKLSSVGDVVHALPVAATLRARLADARVTWLVERRESALVRGHPAVDEVMTVDTRRWRRPSGLISAGPAILGLRAALAHRHIDVAVDLQGLFKSAALAWLSRAPLRIGFAPARCREPLSARLTNRHVVPPSEAVHVIDQYLALLQPVGADPPVHEFRLPSDALADTTVDEFFAGAGLKPRNRVVVLSPGAGQPAKRWPAERFAAVAARLAQERAAAVIVAWGPGEEALATGIVRVAASSRVLLAPPTDLVALVALLRRASVVVAGDTGPLHLAAAADTPCVALWGPRPGERNDARRNGPYGPGHRIVQSPDGQIRGIIVDAVVGAVSELLP